jgi:hypothetical protein
MKEIKLIRYEQQTAVAINPDRYQLNRSGRLPWLQRALFWILRKLKANALETSITYKTIEIDTTKIIDALMRNRVDVERLYNKRAKYVVMGPEAFREFNNAAEVRYFMAFNFNTQIGMNRQITIMGMECIIVPRIEGFFVLPDLNEERSLALG